jgi:excisionase family DNA binding protein
VRWVPVARLSPLDIIAITPIILTSIVVVNQQNREIMAQRFEDYVDVKEASKRLNIHPESVRRLIRQGKLPGIKFANAWLIDAAILEQFAQRYDPRPGNKAPSS